MSFFFYYRGLIKVVTAEIHHQSLLNEQDAYDGYYKYSVMHRIVRDIEKFLWQSVEIE
jgi:hypothetical protein